MAAEHEHGDLEGWVAAAAQAKLRAARQQTKKMMAFGGRRLASSCRHRWPASLSRRCRRRVDDVVVVCRRGSWRHRLPSEGAARAPRTVRVCGQENNVKKRLVAAVARSPLRSVGGHETCEECA